MVFLSSCAQVVTKIRTMFKQIKVREDSDNGCIKNIDDLLSLLAS